MAKASRAAPLVNRMNRARSHRVLVEKTLGIHRDKLLPEFASEPFEKWFERHEPLEGAGREGTLAMFSTCIGDYNFPAVPANAVRVLEKNGFKVERPREQVCCGIPNLDGGDIEAGLTKARKNVAVLIREERPDLRILFMSGYPADVVTARATLPSSTEYLQKPFTAEELLQRVTAALHSGG